MGSKEYEQDQFDRLKTVVEAACQNDTIQSDVTVSTTGDNPSASVTIPGYLLKKFLILKE